MPTQEQIVALGHAQQEVDKQLQITNIFNIVAPSTSVPAEELNEWRAQQLAGNDPTLAKALQERDRLLNEANLTLEKWLKAWNNRAS